MNKKIIFLIAVLFICVGLSGCSYIFDESKGRFRAILEQQYLGATVKVYDVNRPSGGPKELYPFMSAEEYIQKAIPVVKELFDLR